MAAGNRKSPIIRAIGEAEKGTTGEIRVHLSKRWFEKDPYGRAQKLFNQFGMEQTAHRNGVLLYVNLRRRKFAIIGDAAIHTAVGQVYWEELCLRLREDLQSTHSENAIALAVRTVGITLQHYFPAGLEQPKVNELPDDVTED